MNHPQHIEKSYCFNRDASQRNLPQDNFTSFNLRQEKPNTKAYINPQIVNCAYLKRTLCKNPVPGGNKIHVNPNFKGIGFNVAQKNNATLAPRVPELHVNRLNQVQKPGPSHVNKLEISYKATTNAHSTNLGKASVINSSSRFKKVNNIATKCPKNINSSKYSWSREKYKVENICNQFTATKNLQNLDQKIRTQLNNDKVKGYTFPQSAYKYTSPKKVFKSVNVISKSVPERKSLPIFKSKTKIVNKSKTKLIRNVSSTSNLIAKQTTFSSPVKRSTGSSKFVYNKNKKSIIRLANLVRNKYKYYKVTKSSKTSRYKIDKRKNLPGEVKTKNGFSKVHDIRKLFPVDCHKYKFSSKYTFTTSTGTIHKSIHLWRKIDVPEKVNQRKANHFPNKRVVKIGGILYKSTGNKLILAKESKGNSLTNTGKLLNAKDKKAHIVYVRGAKYILDRNGKTLRRQSDNAEKSGKNPGVLKRVDIGGVTYLQKSSNVLIRTNSHQARNLLNQAKHKSIATLCKLRKKSSMNCMIYHKFGRCFRHNKGLCMYKHDPKNIAICKKFLKGNCDDNKCFLSHEVIQEKMATCHFFLNGFCIRENCPFLHVKLNKNAAICKNFLQGFCNLGKNCSERHLYQCPEFDKYGTCTSGTKCLYPHKVKDKKKEGDENPLKAISGSEEENGTVKYYVKSLAPINKQKAGKPKRSLLKERETQNKKDVKKQKKNKRKSSTSEANLDQMTDVIECVPKRVKLDQLPCFIPLKSEL